VGIHGGRPKANAAESSVSRNCSTFAQHVHRRVLTPRFEQAISFSKQFTKNTGGTQQWRLKHSFSLLP
jgi:hypothetical protein